MTVAAAVAAEQNPAYTPACQLSLSPLFAISRFFHKGGLLRLVKRCGRNLAAHAGNDADGAISAAV
jgi:hypothetical protein